MLTLRIGGKSVQVDDSFLKLVPDQQNAAVDEIAGSIGLRGQNATATPQTPYTKPEGYLDAAVQGVPVVGPLLQKAGAAGAAAIQPILGQQPGTTFGQRYDNNLSELQKRSQQFAGENPIGSTAAGLAGGVGATALLGGMSPAALEAMGLGGGELVPNALKGTASGAAIGGADAITRGSDPLAGAELGAAFGGAAPVVGRAIGAAANRFTKPVNAPATVAAQKVAKPLIDEGLTTPDAINARLSSIGPEAMLTDANPNLTQMAGAVASSPGEGQQLLRSAIEQRAANAGNRITGQLDQMMGKPVDLNAMSDNIYQQAKAAATPLYEQARAVPIQSTPELDQVLTSPFGRMASAKARQLALSDPTAPQSGMFSAGIKPTQPLPEWAQSVLKGGQGASRLQDALNQAGISTGQSSVDVHGLHLIRQAYDDMINSAYRQGANVKARNLSMQRGIIDGTLKQVEPFAQADAIYSDMSGIRSAMADGLRVFSSNQAPEDIAAQLRGMPLSQRNAYLQGARVAVRNIMGNARNDAGSARAMFAKDFNQEKLRMLLGNDSTQQILGRIDAERAYNASADRILRNSETASRLQGKADLADAHGLPSYHDVAIFSGAHGLVRRVIADAVKSTLNAITSGRQKEIESNIAKLLTAKGVDRQQALETLMSAALKRDPSGNANRIIAQTVARLPTAFAGGQLATQQ